MARSHQGLGEPRHGKIALASPGDWLYSGPRKRMSLWAGTQRGGACLCVATAMPLNLDGSLADFES